MVKVHFSNFPSRFRFDNNSWKTISGLIGRGAACDEVDTAASAAAAASPIRELIGLIAVTELRPVAAEVRTGGAAGRGSGGGGGGGETAPCEGKEGAGRLERGCDDELLTRSTFGETESLAIASFTLLVELTFLSTEAA